MRPAVTEPLAGREWDSFESRWESPVELNREGWVAVAVEDADVEFFERDRARWEGDPSTNYFSADEAREGVIDGDTVVKFDQSVQSIEFRFGELDDVRPALGTADHRATGDEQHFGQIMLFVSVNSRVGDNGQIRQ